MTPRQALFLDTCLDCFLVTHLDNVADDRRYSLLLADFPSVAMVSTIIPTVLFLEKKVLLAFGEVFFLELKVLLVEWFPTYYRCPKINPDSKALLSSSSDDDDETKLIETTTDGGMVAVEAPQEWTNKSTGEEWLLVNNLLSTAKQQKQTDASGPAEVHKSISVDVKHSPMSQTIAAQLECTSSMTSQNNRRARRDAFGAKR